jgi:hypothetical protein
MVRNPWIGADIADVVGIRRMIDGAPRELDGPPLDARQAAEFRRQLADHIVEAYRAMYLAADDTVVSVAAVRFDSAERASPSPLYHTRGIPRGPTIRIVIGPSVARVSAPTLSSCYGAVRSHVESLGR